MRTATTSALPTIEAPPYGALRSSAPRLLGLAVACLVPSLFWTGIIAVVAYGLDSPLSWKALELIAGSITVFLLVVCAPLMLRHEPTT